MMAEQGSVRGGRVGMRLGGTGSVYMDFNTGTCCRSEISIDNMFLFTVRGDIDVRQPTQEQRAAAEGNGVDMDVIRVSF